MSTEPVMMKFGTTNEQHFTLKSFSVSLFMEINKQTKSTVWHKKIIIAIIKKNTVHIVERILASVTYQYFECEYSKYTTCSKSPVTSLTLMLFKELYSIHVVSICIIAIIITVTTNE